MKKQEKIAKKTLLNKDGHQLLNIKELLDQMLTEAGTIGKEVREAIVNARNVAWHSFVKEQQPTGQQIDASAERKE